MNDLNELVNFFRGFYDFDKECPNCGGLKIKFPDDEDDLWMCEDCETLIDEDGTEFILHGFDYEEKPLNG